MIKARNTIKINFSGSPSAPEAPAEHPAVRQGSDSEGGALPMTIQTPAVEPSSGNMNIDTASVVSAPVTPTTPDSSLRKQFTEVTSLLLPASTRRAGQVFFLVSTSWYHRWYDYVTNPEGTGTPPGPIDNWDLSNNNTPIIRQHYNDRNHLRVKYQLRAGVQEHQDFIALPTAAWDLLKYTYGGAPPFPRIVGEVPEMGLELYPKTPMSVTEALGGDVSVLASATSTTAAPTVFTSHPPYPSSHPQPMAPTPLTTTASAAPMQISPAPKTDSGSTTPLTSPATTPSPTTSPLPPPPPPSATTQGPTPAVVMPRRYEESKPTSSTTASVSSSSSSSSSSGATGGGVLGALGSLLKKPKIGLCDVSTTVFHDCGKSAVPATGAAPLMFCFVCKKVAKNRCGKCSAVSYCSQGCQMAHWKYHKTWCAAAKEHSALPCSQFQTLVPVGRRGKAGLRNLGNSCYLNATLQCLSHVAPLTAYFLSNAYASSLNIESRDGTGGELAKEWANLLGELWFGNSPLVEPVRFKAILGKIKREYIGHQQHDAHEVVELLLDKLHEDVNRILKKPYVERPEAHTHTGGAANGSDNSDNTQTQTQAYHNLAALAATALAAHKQRDSSVVQETLCVQMLSQLSCLACTHTQSHFEFVHTLPIALPRNTTRSVYVCFVPTTTNLANSLWYKTSKTQPPQSPGHVEAIKRQMCVLRSECLRPVCMCVEVDILSPVNKLLNEVMMMVSRKTVCKDVVDSDESSHNNETSTSKPHRISGPSYRLRSGLMLVTPQLPPKPKSKQLVAAQSQELQHTLHPTVQSVISPDFIVGRLPIDPSYLYVYSMPEKRDAFQCLVYQRKVAADGSGVFLRTGYPLHLVCDIDCTCLELRTLIWKQVSRLFYDTNSVATSTGTTYFDEAVFAADTHRDNDALARFAAALPLREVTDELEPFRTDSNSNPAVHVENTTLHFALKSSSSSVNERLAFDCTGGLPPQESARLGELFPNSDDCAAADFFEFEDDRNTPVIYLCLDWSNAWQQALVVEEQMATTKHESVTFAEQSAKTRALAAAVDSASSSSASSNNGNGNNSISLEYCLREHTREEVLDCANSWYCSVCKQHQQARKRVTFWSTHLPSVLVIVLKRFEFRDVSNIVGRAGMTLRDKIDTFVDYPLEGLDLRDYCGDIEAHWKVGEGVPLDGDCREGHKEGGELLAAYCGDLSPAAGKEEGQGLPPTTAPLDADSTKYDLFAVCNHFGRMGFGHYTAVARDWLPTTSAAAENPTGLSSDWYSFDDDAVELVDPKNVDREVLTKNAYILFYKRRQV